MSTVQFVLQNVFPVNCNFRDTSIHQCQKANVPICIQLHLYTSLCRDAEFRLRFLLLSPRLFCFLLILRDHCLYYIFTNCIRSEQYITVRGKHETCWVGLQVDFYGNLIHILRGFIHIILIIHTVGNVVIL